MTNENDMGISKVAADFILSLALYFVIGLFIAALGFVYVYHNAIKRSGKPEEIYSLMIRYGNVLPMLTIVMIVISVIILTILSKIPGTSAAAILSGIAGYVLGSLERNKKSKDEIEPKKRSTDAA